MFPELPHVLSLAWPRGSEKPPEDTLLSMMLQPSSPAQAPGTGGQKASEAIWLNLRPPFLSPKGPG